MDNVNNGDTNSDFSSSSAIVEYMVVYAQADPENDVNLSMTAALLPLYHLAVNDCRKLEIFEVVPSSERNFGEHLQTIIYKGCEIEKLFALNILTQLCFHKKVAEYLVTQTDLCEFIYKLGQNYSSEMNNIVAKKLSVVLVQLIWLINYLDTRRDIIFTSMLKEKHVCVHKLQ